jgi:hypothetical protein
MLRYGFLSSQEDRDADKEDKPDEIIAKLRQVEVKAEMGEEAVPASTSASGQSEKTPASPRHSSSTLSIGRS